MKTTTEFVNELNHKFFKGELPLLFLEKLALLPIDRPDVFAFVQRMFRNMNQAGMPATDMNLLQADILGTLLARILPGAWEGRVPPITVMGRHAEIDAYIKKNTWCSSGGKSMLDIGCGFPPYTTVETAAYLPDWHITGADPSLPYYLLYDAEGNYATFDEDSAIVYFQPAIPSIENWNKLLADTVATKNHFNNLLAELLAHPNDEGYPKLEHNPIANYETEKLSFIRGGIGSVDTSPKDVIRCFNVLYYFDDSFQEKALTWFAEKTTEGGIVLIGGDWSGSTESYYDVYKKTGDRLINKAFAFSIDCICPLGIVTWYTNHDDDRQKKELIKYISMLRHNKPFMAAFYAFHDAQRLQYNFCPRNAQGYYDNVDPNIQPQDLWLKASIMLKELNEAGLNQMAVNVLLENGLQATVNEVGHIEVLL